MEQAYEHGVLEVGLAVAIVAVMAVLAARLRISAVPLFILSGMAVGPHLPPLGPIDLGFVHSEPILGFLGRLGVLFLLFYLGLEFSISRLVRAGRSIITGGSIYIGLNLTLGLLFGYALGWPLREILVAAGITTISSSAIVARVLVDLKRTANPETEIILGITMFEDVFLAVYLSVVSGLVLSGATSVSTVAGSAGLALLFVVGFLVLGQRCLPWLNRILNIASPEVFILVVFAGLLLVSGFGETLHVAEAIGALLFGLTLGDTAHRHEIEQFVIPFRDFLGALFFFHFGLTIDPRALGGAVGIALAAVLLTIVGNCVAGLLAGRRAGLSTRASLNIGLTVVGRGEFSIIMATLGAAGGLMPILQPFAALYVLCLAVLGPVLAKESRRIYAFFTYPMAGRKTGGRHPGSVGSVSGGVSKRGEQDDSR